MALIMTPTREKAASTLTSVLTVRTLTFIPLSRLSRWDGRTKFARVIPLIFTCRVPFSLACGYTSKYEKCRRMIIKVRLATISSCNLTVPVALTKAQNLKYHITGLENIRVLDCSVNFSISPETQVIDFVKFNLLDIRRHTMSKTFSIKTTKSQNDQCTDGFKVSSSFYTEETLVEEDKALLIGNGLKLRLLDENASPYTFNKYAEYADFTSDMLIYEKTYTAELSSIAGTPIEAGPFDTVVLFKINYN